MTIFDWITQILVHRKSWDDFTEDDQKKFSPFIINRWLSMDNEFIEVVNYFQKYSIGLLKSKEVYKWYCDVLPKGKRFNKYIKNNRAKKYDEFLINTLCNHYECSKLEVSEYMKLINKDDLITILGKYGTSSKQIENICKRNL